MSHIYDFPRFSTAVGAIVDRRLRSVSDGVIGATGFLRSLVTQAEVSATLSTTKSAVAVTAAADATAAKVAAQTVNISFRSTYGGVLDSDPIRSSLGNVFNVGAFFIRKGDRHLRVVTSVAANGNPTWSDAAVIADSASVLAVVDGKFLSTTASESQNVSSLVTFFQGITVPRLVDWSKDRAVGAYAVNALVDSVKLLVTAEVNRAKDSEQSIKLLLSNEITRAKAAEVAVTTSLGQEVTRATGAEGVLTTNLAAEVTRAKAAEGANATAITTESNRAKGIEQGLTTSLGQEVTRATGAEDTLRTDLGTEKARAIAAEGAILEEVSDEVTRATTAEGDLSAQLAAFMAQFSHGSNQFGRWEIRPGIVEMGGIIVMTSNIESIVQVTFPLQLANSNYNILVTPMVTSPGNKQDLWVQGISSSKTANGFSVQYQSDDADDNRLDGFEWSVTFLGTATPLS